MTLDDSRRYRENLNSLSKSSTVERSGFTIVELLVVIVVIGVLAGIVMVSYSGVRQRAIEASLQADAKNSSNKIELFKAVNSTYPLTSNCAQADSSTNLCLRTSNGALYNYLGSENSYSVSIDNGDLSYSASNNTPISKIVKSYALSLGGAGTDSGRSLVLNDDGGYTVSGYTNSFGAGSYDLVTTRYSASGAVLWSKVWGGASDDYGFSIDKSTDGGYIVSGQTASYGNGYSDVVVNKYSSDGNLLWSNIWGSTGIDFSLYMKATSDGGCIVTGSNVYNWGTADYGVLITKYDSNGDISWSKRWSADLASNDDRGYTVIQTSDGGFAIAGFTNSFGAGSNDVVLLKLTSEGALSWNRTWGGAGNDEAFSVSEDSSNNLIVTGATNSYGVGDYDMFINKYSSTGTLVWNKTWGGAAFDKGYGILAASDGSYIVTGQTTSFGAGSYDVLVIKYNSDGSMDWNRTWGGTGDERGYYVTNSITSGYTIAGFATSYGAGGYDSILLKYRSNGDMDNCFSPICQIPSATITTPSATVNNPAVTLTDSVGSRTVISGTETSPSFTLTKIVNL